MIWLAFVALLTAVSTGGAYLTFRLRNALRTQRTQIDSLRTIIDDRSQALEGTRTELKKTNERAAQRRKVIEENRTGVQEAKDRAALIRADVNKRQASDSKAVADLRLVGRQHGAALNSARSEVQRLREQIREIATSEPTNSSAASPLDMGFREDQPSKTLRTATHIQAALERLENVALRTSPVHEYARDPRPEVDLSVLLPQDGGPRVSVVVTCFNDADYLADCLRSVQSQTLVEFECIVVDDASTDNSREVATQIVSADDRFRLVEHAHNLGPSAARNTGIRAAQAPFICFLDSDDMFLRQNLEQRLFSYLRLRDPAIAGVFSGVEHRSADVTFRDLPDELPWAAPTRRSLVSTRGECPFNLHAPLLRTDIIRRSGGFDEALRVGAEDWELWLRLMRNGFVFEPCHTVLAIYRQKPQSLVRAFPADHLAISAVLLNSVHRDAEPSTRMSRAPFFFSAPLGEYDQKILLAERGHQYLALASLADNSEQLDRAIEALPSGLDSIIDHHVNRSGQILAGLRRGLGLSAQDFALVQPEARLVQSNLRNLALQPTPDTPEIVLPSPIARKSEEPLGLFYWQAGPDVPGAKNFGDELSPLLVALASGRKVERAEIEDCDLVALGSVLDLTLGREHRSPAIWGSGFIKEGPATGAGLAIHAVRGKLTNERCGGIGAIGDPALLARYLEYGDADAYRVGLLPHYVDVDQPFCAQFLDKVDGAVLIHPLQPPLEVLAQIDACDIVFSSSLHGLICADSVGTPNAWVELSRNVVGDGYKFADYYSCFDLTPTALRPMDPRELEHAVEDITSTYSRPQLDRLCADLIDAFPSNL